MNRRIYIILLLWRVLLSPSNSYGQTVDSLEYYRIESNKLITENPNLALKYIDKSYSFLNEKNISTKKVMDIIKGKILTQLGIYDSSAFYLNRALEAYHLSPNTDRELTILHALALNLDYSGKYDKAVEAYFEVVKLGEKSEMYSFVAGAYSNIAIILKLQGNLDQAEEIYFKVLKIDSVLQDTIGMAADYSNLGNLYDAKLKFELALKYYIKALDYSFKANSLYGQAMSYGNIGTAYYYLKNYSEAIENYNLGLDVYTEMDYEMGKVDILRNLASIYRQTGKPDLGLEMLLKAEKLSSQSQDIQARHKLYYEFALIYSDLNQPDKAYEYLAKYTYLKDSVFKETSAKQITEMQEKYNSEKKDSEIKLLNKSNELNEVEIKAQNLQLQQEKSQRITLYGGLGLMILFGIFMVNRYRVTKKQKNIIQKQKDIVEEAHYELGEKNKEITDSIRYAKRIQSAILPPEKVVKEYLQESFILYKPKDIVAGDFYWLEQKDGLILFAAADCTGHGVPGAMVSVICNNGLNRSVREHGLTDPGEILDKTREIVIAEFEKSEEDVKDGMDIALCSLEFVRSELFVTSSVEQGTKNEKQKTVAMLKYAGAHNPLWIIRNGGIIETKADKEPIGKFDKQTLYTTHTFELQKDDTIYIFSDGYVDQFGGEKGKKFKTKAFRQLLLSIQDKPMEEQRIIINNKFETWKGDVEQIDDVCIIGVRI